MIDSKEAGNELKKASRYRVKGLKLMFGAVLGTIGGVFGAVFGAGIGAGVGGAAGFAGGVGIGTKLEKIVKRKHAAVKLEGPV